MVALTKFADTFLRIWYLVPPLLRTGLILYTTLAVMLTIAFGI